MFEIFTICTKTSKMNYLLCISLIVTMLITKNLCFITPIRISTTYPVSYYSGTTINTNNILNTKKFKIIKKKYICQSNWLLPISLFNLENIVTSRAIMSSLITRFQQEFVSDNTFMNEIINNKSNYQIDLFYIFTFMASIYFENNYILKFNKLDKFKIFVNSRRYTNMILIFIIVLLVKNVENAI